MCGSMVDIQSVTTENRREKKKKEEKTTAAEYNGSPTEQPNNSDQQFKRVITNHFSGLARALSLVRM